jgi:hypothetical protein
MSKRVTLESNNVRYISMPLAIHKVSFLLLAVAAVTAALFSVTFRQHVATFASQHRAIKRSVHVGASKPTPIPIIVSGDVGGGTGNQIEHMLGHIALVRKFKLDFIMPQIIPRTSSVALRPSDVWDLALLQRSLPGHVYETVPQVCNSVPGRHAHVLITKRDNDGAAGDPAIYVAPESLQQDTIRVVIDRGGLNSVPDIRLFVMDLIRRRSLHTPYVNNTAICVHLGIFSHGADWDFAPLLASAPAIVKAARKWPLDTMGVVHLRYDENRCLRWFPKRLHHSKVICVMVEKLDNTGYVRWVPTEEYASTIARAVRENGVGTLYIAKSAYMPAAAWNSLRSALEVVEGIKLARPAGMEYENDLLNFVEREIARRCLFFIADVRSTWSQTIVRMRDNSRYVYASKLFSAMD